MNIKRIKIHKRDDLSANSIVNNKSIDIVLNKIREAAFIKDLYVEDGKIKGIDKDNNSFYLTYQEDIVYIDLKIQSNNYDLVRDLSKIILEEVEFYTETKIENQFTYMQDMKKDIRVIKGILIFYLILTVLGFFLS